MVVQRATRNIANETQSAEKKTETCLFACVFAPGKPTPTPTVPYLNLQHLNAISELEKIRTLLCKVLKGKHISLKLLRIKFI